MLRSDDAKKCIVWILVCDTERILLPPVGVAWVRLGKSLYQKGTAFDPDFVYLFVKKCYSQL